MLVDTQTLQDLGIIHSRSLGASLFDQLSFTRTVGGTNRLKERFRNPLPDAEQVRAVQDALRFLTHHGGRFDTLLDGSDWLSVEHYMNSPFALLHPSSRTFIRLNALWVRYRHGEMLRQVCAGLAATQSLARRADSLVTSLAHLDPPQLLADWAEALRLCLTDRTLQVLLAGKDATRLSSATILLLDRSLRSDGFSPLSRVAKLVYEVDALRSLAYATRERGFVFPEVIDSMAPCIEAEGLYHPALESPVSNPLRVSSDSRLMFLTGPNMAGKSTYLRSAGIAVYLAQLGMGVPAASFRFTPFQCLFSGINTTDNIRLGQSYFFREVRRVREIALVLSRGTSAFVLFDEMFKGTNLKDASDACLAVLSGFTACKTSAFIIASHLSEIAEEVSRLDSVDLCHFGAKIEDGHPSFDYLLQPGISDQRLGMLILERERVLELLGKLRIR